VVDNATATGDLAARRAGKSAAAFRTISEVAADLDVQPHVLRFWESKFPQIKPLKRGGGRRYYRPEDVDLLRRIRVLLYRDGYTIKGVQKLLRGVAARPGPQEDEAEDDAIEQFVEATAPAPQNQPIQLELATEKTSAAPTSVSSHLEQPALPASLAASSDIASDVKAVIKMLAELRDRLRAS
jgi:DNA-binding transcriptional MerR regulator